MPRDIQPTGFLVNYDCRHYSGYRPCGINPVCEGCDHYDPIGKRVLIIKLGAMGDVLRTTPVTTAIKREWPDAHITWLTMPESRDLLKNNPHIDQLLIWDHETTLYLQAVKFDLLLNLDKDLAGLALGEQIEASEIRGFCLTQSGQVGIADERAGYALRLGIDDDLKFKVNEQCVQQVVCESVGLRWEGDLYVFEPDEVSRRKHAEFFERRPWLRDKTLVAICTGCGPGFPTKRWAKANIVELIRTVRSWPDTVPMLCGGVLERDLNREIMEEVGKGLLDTGTENTLDEFVGILMASSAVVTADSMPMHLAVALGKPVVALFGPTTPREVSLGPLGEMIVTDIECSPCYLKRCSQTESGEPLCMEQMGAASVSEALQRTLAKDRR